MKEINEETRMILKTEIYNAEEFLKDIEREINLGFYSERYVNEKIKSLESRIRNIKNNLLGGEENEI